MKEFIKKLIERLEKTRWTTIFDTSCIFENDKLDKCIKIVNELAEEYMIDVPTIDASELFSNSVNDGWIPCSERLPDTNDDVLCWYEYFRYGEYNRMYETYGIGHYWKQMNIWGGEVSTGHKCRVIAWQPLPAPYQPKE